jgi:hypothetical protein
LEEAVKHDPFRGLDNVDMLEIVKNEDGEYVPNPEQKEVKKAKSRKRAEEKAAEDEPALELGEKFERIFTTAFRVVADAGVVILRGENVGLGFAPPENYEMEAREYKRNILYFIERKRGL